MISLELFLLLLERLFVDGYIIFILEERRRRELIVVHLEIIKNG
jgi:hypothetical protein